MISVEFPSKGFLAELILRQWLWVSGVQQMEVDPQSVRDWGQASKALIDLGRAILSSIPVGDKRAEYEAKLRAAEEAQRRADAVLAQQLGYLMCKCTFPPNPMLWRQDEQSYVCSAGCGQRTDPPSGPLSPKFGTMA